MTDSDTVATPRRRFVGALMWSAPAIAATSLVPAHAASSTGAGIRMLLSDPPVNFGTFDPERTVPVYRFATGNNVRTLASLPPSVVLRNEGTAPVTDPSGRMTVTMRDYGSDYAPVGANQFKVTSPMAQVSVQEERTRIGSREGARFGVTYRGTISPGQAINVPLRYFVNPPFRNVTFNVLVTVETAGEGGATASRDDKMGYVPGFGGWI